MANSADPDQLASEEANWSGPTLFAKAGYIQVQKDNGYITKTRLFKYIENFTFKNWKFSDKKTLIFFIFLL